jgi:hypothetical protein
MRALVPIAKGSEIFINACDYYIFDSRPARRKNIAREYDFVCQCEVCTLPDHLSDARDAKLWLAGDASDFIWGVLKGRTLLRTEADVRRGLKGLQAFFSFIMQERTLSNMLPALPVFFFTHLGLEKPLRDIGKDFCHFFSLYWDPVSARHFARIINNPRTNENWELYKRLGTPHLPLHRLDDLIQETVSSIVSDLRRFAL